MFDRVIAPQPAKRWKTFLLIGTASGHAAVLAGLVLVAFWKIDKLPLTNDREIRVSVQAELPPPGGPPPGEKLAVKEKRVVKPPPPPVAVQPVHLEQAPPDPTGGGTTATTTPGGGGNNPDGDPNSRLIGDGRCAEPPCGEVEKPRPKPPVVVETKAPPIVTPNVAAGLRLSGNDKIYPPDSVRVSMVHDGKDSVIGSVKLCVSASGVVESVKTAKSTGYDDYDRALLDAMRGWRYRPYTVNGVATPMCTVAQVIYRMTR